MLVNINILIFRANTTMHVRHIISEHGLNHQTTMAIYSSHMRGSTMQVVVLG